MRYREGEEEVASDYVQGGAIVITPTGLLQLATLAGPLHYPPLHRAHSAYCVHCTQQLSEECIWCPGSGDSNGQGQEVVRKHLKIGGGDTGSIPRQAGCWGCFVHTDLGDEQTGEQVRKQTK